MMFCFLSTYLDSSSIMVTVRVLETLGMVLLFIGVVSAAIRQSAWPERFQILIVTAGALTMVFRYLNLETKMSRNMSKPTMWILTWSDTNQGCTATEDG